MLGQFKSLPALFKAFPDNETALKHFEGVHWKNGAFCPYCKGARVMHFKDGKTYKCSDCRKRFSSKTGTIFEDTKLGMHIWFGAMWLLLNRPKGIASTQLAVDLDITQKSAWFVLHRLRYASRTRSFNRPLAGEVEADETYVGGKARNMSKERRERTVNGTGGAGKTIVIGVIERGGGGTPGEVRAMTIPDTKTRTIQSVVRGHVAPGTTLMTDSAVAYVGMPEYTHETVNHFAREYARGPFHTNSIEGFWSLFKRQYHGTRHWISPKHMNAYLDEACYRFDRRETDRTVRVDDLLTRVAGRITYGTLIADGQEKAAS